MSDPAINTPPVTPSQFLSDPGWKSLLLAINKKKNNVIPIVGPGLVTVPDGQGGFEPLTRWLAPRLAGKLGLPPAPFTSLNQAVCAFLLNGGERKVIYEKLGELLSENRFEPSPALRALASIRDFNLYVSATFDGLLAQALCPRWPGCSRDGIEDDPRFFVYHPNKQNDLPKTVEIARLKGPILYHILGHYNSLLDFAVWEDDYIEYICGLQQQAATLENLFGELTNRPLLLLGAPYTDWIVRFFLRVAKQERLSALRYNGQQLGLLADSSDNLSQPMLFFMDEVLKATRIVSGDPSAFVLELVRRWRAEYGLRKSLSRETPRGAMFISYAHADSAAALNLAETLAAAQIPVWLDTERLEGGENYNHNLEFAVRDSCSFFLSLISRSTEAHPDKYYHIERAWAAERAVPGHLFYIPVIIDNLPAGEVKLEPAKFKDIQRYRLPDGEATPEFLARLTQALEEFHAKGKVRC